MNYRDIRNPGPMVSGEGRSSRAADIAKTLGFFAVFLSAGWFLSKRQERKQLEEEKAAFRRLGMDWSQRARY